MNNGNQLFMYVYYPKYNREENKLGKSWQTLYHIAETDVQVCFVCSVVWLKDALWVHLPKCQEGESTEAIIIQLYFYALLSFHFRWADYSFSLKLILK